MGTNTMISVPVPLTYEYLFTISIFYPLRVLFADKSRYGFF